MHAEPNLFGIMVEQKLPGFVSLREAGYGDTPTSLENIKKVIIGFVNKGYYGNLHFYRDCQDNVKHRNSATCQFYISPREENPRTTLSVSWNNNNATARHSVSPIFSACVSMNLRKRELANAKYI